VYTTAMGLASPNSLSSDAGRSPDLNGQVSVSDNTAPCRDCQTTSVCLLAL
jgi:hypothetical protein